MDEPGNQDTRPHYLLTALGTGPVTTTYALNGDTAEANHSPLALLKLLDDEDRPGTVLCLLTDKARKTAWTKFAEETKDLGVNVEPVDISDIDSTTQMAEMIRALAQKIQPDSRLMLDITQGPRHIPFVFYALALYLSGFRNVEITGAWYGNFVSKEADKPLIDLQPLLNLPEWFYAVKLFQDSDIASALAERFQAVQTRLPAGPERGPSVKAYKALQEFSATYESGLPLELGLAAGMLSHVLNEIPLDKMPGLELPLASELAENIMSASAPLRFDQDQLRDGRSKGKWKEAFVLTQRELCRQAGLIDRYIEHDQFPLAIGLMREWIVSLGLFHQGKNSDWLQRDARISIERELGAMRQAGLREMLDDEQREWGKFWDQLCQQRNQFAHHGMRTDSVNTNVKNIKAFWEQIKSGDKAWPSFGGGRGRLLITPLGMSPGVLYSAIGQTRPDSVLILCSEQAKPGIAEAIKSSGFNGHYPSITMQDPFSGIDEVKGILEKSRKTCLDADEVLVNLTGGTAMMGVAIQRLYEQSRNDQRPSRRFVLTDKRPQEEQKSNPWVEAGIFWLDQATDQGEGHD